MLLHLGLTGSSAGDRINRYVELVLLPRQGRKSYALLSPTYCPPARRRRSS